MKKTMNKWQENYIEAKASVEALERMIDIEEEKFVKESGIKNKDGSIPKYTWTIDDDDLANKMIDSFGKILEESGASKKLFRARAELKKAEEELIEYALSIIPTSYESQIESLRKGAKNDYKVREKIIDTVLRLDVSTVH